MDELLQPEHRALLDAEREALERLKRLLETTEAPPETVAQLDDLIAHLDELFLVVVVGEFNAGKSSVLNALFGEKIMEEGPIPTTAKITILRYGPEKMERQLSSYLLERRYPSDLLRHLNLVDTPGTNSIIKQHQQITEDFIPRSDLVLFITSFDRPLSESERQFLEFIRGSWGKRLVFVLNKADLARTEEMLTQVIEHIRSGCQELLGFEPRVFPVSAELAYAAKTAEQASVQETLWQQSRFEPLETFILETLAGPERLALKLAAPLDSAGKLLEATDRRLAARTDVLGADRAQLQELEDHFAKTEAELRDGYNRYLAELDNVLLQMERRGVQFLEDNIRVSKLSLLRDRDAFKEEFKRQVIRDNERALESHLTEAVDWLLRHVLGLWNWTLSRFNAQLRDRTAGSVAQGEFHYNRAEVFDKIRREAERRSQAYDLNEEARRILENARSAAALFLGAEGIAAGIGTVAAIVIATTAADVTGGFIAAGALALFGFLFLPRQKRKAIQEFTSRIDALRDELRQALRTQLDQEIDQALAKVRELVAPYAHLVEQETEALAAARDEQAQLEQQLAALQAGVTRTFGDVRLGDA